MMAAASSQSLNETYNSLVLDHINNNNNNNIIIYR
jgi:hypothetical protein